MDKWIRTPSFLNFAYQCRVRCSIVVSEPERMGFSIRTPVGCVWRMSYLCRCRVRVGHPDTARGWGVYASLTRTGMNNSILKHHVDLRFNFLSPAKCTPPNKITYLKAKSRNWEGCWVFWEFLAVERLERTELEEEAILQSIGWDFEWLWGF